MSPDIVVLTEYVEGQDHDEFLKALDAGGLSNVPLTAKTEGLIPVTPEIKEVIERARHIGTVKGTTVIHNLAGGQYSKDGIETAWQRACERAGVKDAHFHDLRAKALSDAKRRGVDLSMLQDAAGHSSVTTTEGYLRGREIKVSALGLTLPGVSNLQPAKSTDKGEKPAANSSNG